MLRVSLSQAFLFLLQSYGLVSPISLLSFPRGAFTSIFWNPVSCWFFSTSFGKIRRPELGQNSLFPVTVKLQNSLLGITPLHPPPPKIRSVISRRFADHYCPSHPEQGHDWELLYKILHTYGGPLHTYGGALMTMNPRHFSIAIL